MNWDDDNSDGKREYGGRWVPDGAQTKNARRPEKHIPEWANSDAALRLRIVGPALRNYEIARLYWRVNLTAREVAEELNMSENAVAKTIGRLLRAARKRW